MTATCADAFLFANTAAKFPVILMLQGHPSLALNHFTAKFDTIQQQNDDPVLPFISSRKKTCCVA